MEHHPQAGHVFPPQSVSPASHQFAPRDRRAYSLVANMTSGMTLQDGHQTSPIEYSSIQPSPSSSYVREVAMPSNRSPLGYAPYTEVGYRQLPPINIPPGHWREQERTDLRSADSQTSPLERSGHRYNPYPPPGGHFDRTPPY